jgi:hypothetical protein
MDVSLVKKHSDSLAHYLGLRRDHFSQALSRGDGAGAAQVIGELVAAQHSVADIYLKVFAPALVSIGDAWCSSEIGVGERSRDSDRHRSDGSPVFWRSSSRARALPDLGRMRRG